MASKRDLKRQVRKVIFDVLNDCDYITMNDAKNADAADRLMDEAVDFHDQILPRISRAKTKAEFRDLIAEIQKTGESFIDRLNQISS